MKNLLNTTRIKRDTENSGIILLVMGINAIIAAVYKEWLLAILIVLFVVVILLLFIMQLVYVIAFSEKK